MPAPRSGADRFAMQERNDLEPVVGFEPTTDGLQNRCSTTELNWPKTTRGFIGHSARLGKPGPTAWLRSPFRQPGPKFASICDSDVRFGLNAPLDWGNLDSTGTARKRQNEKLKQIAGPLAAETAQA